MLFIKDIEKSVVGNSEVLKSKLESLPPNVVVIGSHIHPDNRKEKVLFDYICKQAFDFNDLMIRGKFLLLDLMTASLCFQTHPGSLLFTKFGSNQTALLDLAFPV